MRVSCGVALLGAVLLLASCGSSAATRSQPRLAQHGSVTAYEVGENITTKSYRAVIRRFGPPLRSFSAPGNTRCLYYAVVGYPTGWVFCFRGQRMLSAAGNQTPPRKGH